MKKVFILTLSCIAVCLSCSKEQTPEVNPQMQISEPAPASLDGIWQKTYVIGAYSQDQSYTAENSSLVAVIDGSLVRMSSSLEEGQYAEEGTLSYDPCNGSGMMEFASTDVSGTLNVSKVEIIQAFDGGKLISVNNDSNTEDASFGESRSLLVAVISLTDETRDTCVFQQISPLQIQAKESSSQLFGPVGGVKEITCNNGETVRTDSWMSNLPDSILLRRLTIPGTHDAATSSIPLIVLGKDQMYDLKEQLDMGVRYFDLRIDDAGAITHGGIHTKYSFQSAMDEMFQWLDAHPSEGILAEIRWEKDKVAYAAYEIMVEAQISAAKAYNSSVGRFFSRKMPVPDLETELNEWCEKSKAAYFKVASAVLEEYKDRMVLIDNNLTLGQLRGKISFYDSDDNALVDVSGHTERGDYPDSHGMFSDEEFQARIAGVLQSMDDFTASAQSDEFFGKVCSVGYIESWFTEGQIPFAKEMAPHVIGKSDELVNANKTIHAIVMMDYAPLQLNGKGSSFLDNLIKMNFPSQK